MITVFQYNTLGVKPEKFAQDNLSLRSIKQYDTTKINAYYTLRRLFNKDLTLPSIAYDFVSIEGSSNFYIICEDDDLSLYLQFNQDLLLKPSKKKFNYIKTFEITEEEIDEARNIIIDINSIDKELRGINSNINKIYSSYKHHNISNFYHHKEIKDLYGVRSFIIKNKTEWGINESDSFSKIHLEMIEKLNDALINETNQLFDLKDQAIERRKSLLNQYSTILRIKQNV